MAGYLGCKGLPSKSYTLPTSSYVFSQFSSSFLFCSPDTRLMHIHQLSFSSLACRKKASFSSKEMHSHVLTEMTIYTQIHLLEKGGTAYYHTLKFLDFHRGFAVEMNLKRPQHENSQLTLAHFCDILEILFHQQFFQIDNKNVAFSPSSILFLLMVTSLPLNLFKSEPLVHFFFLPLLSGHWRNHCNLLCFFKASNLSNLGLEDFGALLSQTLITDSHNTQPVDSHQQTPLGGTFTPYLPLFTIYPSTHLLPLVLDK